MATSDSSSKRKDFKEEFLTCSICAEPYDNEEHQAKFLPCLHTYCKSCLQNYAKKHPNFNCPICRKEAALPGGTTDSLPNNFLVNNLKEYQDICNLEVVCGNCDELKGNQAVSFCHDCGCFLCAGCVKKHHSMRSLSHHDLSTMAELQEKKYSPAVRKKECCGEHPTQDLTMYCKNAKCKIAICATCFPLHHQKHDIIDLSIAIDEMIAEMQQSAAWVSDKNQKLIEKQVAFEVIQAKLSENFKQKEKEMSESVQKIQHQLNSCLNGAHGQLKHLYQAEMIRLRSCTKAAELLAAQMNTTCEFANKACDMSHPTQLLTSRNQIMDRLHELENTELPETTSDKTDFAFTTKHHSAVEQMQESLQHLCDTELWLRQSGNENGSDINQEESPENDNQMGEGRNRNGRNVNEGETLENHHPPGVSDTHWEEILNYLFLISLALLLFYYSEVPTHWQVILVLLFLICLLALYIVTLFTR